MKNIINKSKKVAVATMAALCAVSSFAAISASATTTNWTHTVSVASIPGSTDSIVAELEKSGKISDTFANYPTIYNGFSRSNNQARAFNYTINKDYGWQDFTLIKDYPSTVTVSYNGGAKVSAGSYYVQYRNKSEGGFRSSAVFSITY